MARPRTTHRCTQCGAMHSRWSGRCGSCGEWNCLVAEVEEHSRPAAAVVVPWSDDGLDGLAAARSIGPLPLTAVDAVGAAARPSGIPELDRVLGGGLVPSSVTLLGGEPGIGKSTLLLQLLAGYAAAGEKVMLVAGEESLEQVRRRADRLGAAVEGVSVLASTDLCSILGHVAEMRPAVLVVDSIQTITDPTIGSAAGTVAQVRECAAAIVRLAKQTGVAGVLAGHVTKEGTLAGPRSLEHIVDTVLSFEGERHHALRLLTAVKHRFGPAGELGVFEMTERGLVSVADPSGMLLGERSPFVPGCVVVPVAEGQRPLLLELQALVTKSSLANPRRNAQGIPPGRLALTLAVLQRHLELSLGQCDVFASIVGGLRVTEPAIDLGLGIALVSAVVNVPLPPEMVICGEVGLGGEVRQVGRMQQRLAEARRLGFERAVVAASAPDGPPGLSLVRVRTLAEAVKTVVGGSLEAWVSGAAPR